MEILKLNETYSISDNSREGWKLNGNTHYEESGNINLNVDVNNELGEHIGSMSYNKSTDGKIYMSVCIDEVLRNEFITYANDIVDSVLTHFA